MLDFSVWLQALGQEMEQQPVGIAAQENVVALATKTHGWIVPTASPVGVEVLKSIIMSERGSPFLVSRDLAADVYVLGNLFQADALGKAQLAKNIQHCMTALSYATGHAIMERSGKLLAIQDALDTAVVGPMMALNPPRYYSRVGLPVVRHNAAFNLEEIDMDGWTRWVITYDHLLLRVMTHLTRDPTLIRWFRESVAPIEQFSHLSGLEPRQATAMFLWMGCGENEETMTRYHGPWMQHLPASPKLVQAQYIDKHLPALRMGLIQLLDQYATHPTATTLYGRKPAFGLRPPELLHYVLFGSINDLLDVAVASIVNQESQTHWLLPEKSTGYNIWVRANIVGWTQRPAAEWQASLDHIAPLANPLVIELSPRTVVG